MLSFTPGTVMGYLLGLLVVFVSARIFFTPFRLILKFILNSIIGAGLLFLINVLPLNIHIGINAVSALTVGILGIPGLCLLLVLQIFF